MESSLNQKLDGLQSEMGHKFDNLQNSISRLTNQQVHQEEESLEEGCLSDTLVEEQCQQQLLFESSNIGAVVYPWEKNSPMLNEEGSGKDVVEEPQEHNLHLPSTDPVYTVYIMPATQPIVEAPALAAEARAIPHSLPMLKTSRSSWPLFKRLPLHRRH